MTMQIVTTTTSPQLPNAFGFSWDAFSREWYLGDSLGYSQTESVRALDALKRLWPEKVAKLLANPRRGLAIIVKAIDDGGLLADCEHMHGFETVLHRLKRGERSAYSELVLGSSLAKLGFRPTFHAELNGKALDACCEVEGRPVYFEVIAPDRADHSINAQQMINELGKAIRASVSACRVEVVLLTSVDQQMTQKIADAVRDASSGEWVTVDSIARIRRINEGQKLSSTFDGEGVSIVFAGERGVQGPSTAVVISWEDNDERAKRLFNAEYHHFSEEVANILVGNVCAVADGMKSWTAWMNRVFQPKQNRKVGAVVLFEQGVLGCPEAISRQWRVTTNPYAHLAIPHSLIHGFESLDQSERWLGKHEP
jgi:hypothetical protein